jgi:hypothetical protein
MAGIVTVRFHEHERYDITTDQRVITFIATTDRGSYFCEMVVDGPKSIRDARREFKDAALDLIQSGDDPCELTFETVH